jgi:hypothetical protein
MVQHLEIGAAQGTYYFGELLSKAKCQKGMVLAFG